MSMGNPTAGRIVNDLQVWGQQPAFVRAAFTHGVGKKVKLPAGMRLSKLSDFPSVAPPGSPTLSPWWSPFDPYEYDGGFENRVRMAKNLGVSIRELSRVFVAVKENWNSLNYLLIVQLRVPVYAFFGGVGGQVRIDKVATQGPATQGGQAPAMVNAPSKLLAGEGRGRGGLAGGASQFYIPNLTPAHAVLVESRSLLLGTRGPRWGAWGGCGDCRRCGRRDTGMSHGRPCAATHRVYRFAQWLASW